MACFVLAFDFFSRYQITTTTTTTTTATTRTATTTTIATDGFFLTVTRRALNDSLSQQ